MEGDNNDDEMLEAEGQRQSPMDLQLKSDRLEVRSWIGVGGMTWISTWVRMGYNRRHPHPSHFTCLGSFGSVNPGSGSSTGCLYV